MRSLKRITHKEYVDGVKVIGFGVLPEPPESDKSITYYSIMNGETEIGFRCARNSEKSVQGLQFFIKPEFKSVAFYAMQDIISAVIENGRKYNGTFTAHMKDMIELSKKFVVIARAGRNGHFNVEVSKKV